MEALCCQRRPALVLPAPVRAGAAPPRCGCLGGRLATELGLAAAASAGSLRVVPKYCLAQGSAEAFCAGTR